MHLEHVAVRRRDQIRKGPLLAQPGRQRRDHDGDVDLLFQSADEPGVVRQLGLRAVVVDLQLEGLGPAFPGLGNQPARGGHHRVQGRPGALKPSRERAGAQRDPKRPRSLRDRALEAHPGDARRLAPQVELGPQEDQGVEPRGPGDGLPHRRGPAPLPDVGLLGDRTRGSPLAPEMKEGCEDGES
jgi:hypothetical protein